MKITVLLGLWWGWRPLYAIEHVRALAAQLREFAEVPLRIALLTDEPTHTARDAHVDVVARIPEQPEWVGPGHGSPASCWRRLRYFDPAFSAQFGTEWVLSLDLDTLVLEPLGELLEHMTTAPGGLSIIRGRFAGAPGARPYNGGMYAIRVGAHADVWEHFDWRTSPAECHRSGWTGSDQVWIGLRAPGARTVGPEHGVYFAEQYMSAPADKAPARIVTFAGHMKPWSKTARRETPEYWRAYHRFSIVAERPAPAV